MLLVNYTVCVRGTQLSDWLAEKMLAAQDETYRDAKNIHSKWMRHQAFESEIKSNKDRLERLVKEGNDLIEQKPELAKVEDCRLFFVDFFSGEKYYFSRLLASISDHIVLVLGPVFQSLLNCQLG